MHSLVELFRYTSQVQGGWLIAGVRKETLHLEGRLGTCAIVLATEERRTAMMAV